MSNQTRKGWRQMPKSRKTKIKPTMTLKDYQQLVEQKIRFLDMNLQELTKAAKEFYHAFPDKHVEDVSYEIRTGDIALTEANIVDSGTAFDTLNPKPYTIPLPAGYEGETPRYGFAYLMFKRTLSYDSSENVKVNPDLGEKALYNIVERPITHIVIPLAAGDEKTLQQAFIKLLDDFTMDVFRSGFMAIEHERERIAIAQAKLNTKDLHDKLAEVKSIFDHATINSEEAHVKS